MNAIFARLATALLSKKRIIAWGAAVALALGAAAAGMTTQEFKDAVVDAPVINIPGVSVEVAPPANTAAAAPVANPKAAK